MRMKRVNLTLIFVIVFLSGMGTWGVPLNTWQNFSKEVEKLSVIEKVSLDNRFIQTYRGNLGIWLKVGAGEKIEKFAKKYKTTLAKINELNDSPLGGKTARKSGFLFIPYSREYSEYLTRSGIERHVYTMKSGEFLWPVKGIYISSRMGSRWGRTHHGVDIAAARNSLVLAARDGVVKATADMGAYGGTVMIDHGSGFVTQYSHLSGWVVRPGEKVVKGQIIAFSGNTGRSTGPHLHFEVRAMSDIVLNPEQFTTIKFEDFKEEMTLFEADMAARNKMTASEIPVYR